MFKNYFTIIFRNLWRNKLYTIINIVGLGVGIAALVWGIQNYRFSFSFNNFHKNGENIFRMMVKADGSDNLKGVCPAALAQSAKSDFSSVKDAVRWEDRQLNIKADRNEAFASRVNFTDPGFFDLFNFPIVKGTNNIKDRSAVLVTEETARKFFGDADPIGKTLLFYSDQPYSKPLKVTGVLKNAPVNSSIHFDIITSIDNRLRPDGSVIRNDDWSWFSQVVFLRLSNPSQATALINGFKKYLPLEQSARRDIKLGAFAMEPLSKVAGHVNGNEIDSNALYPRPQDSAAYGPLVLAILILLSACLNFANTSVAQSNRRLKEIGVRKVMGSSYRQIMLQQLLECSFVVLMALIFCVVINNYWLPAFNAMFTYVEIKADYLHDYSLLAGLVLIWIFVTVLAGAYPAFYLSKFNAANIFRGSVKFGGTNFFSRILLGLQIVISFITIIAGVAFSRNATFQRHYDYGYEKDNVIGIDLQDDASYAALRDQLGKIGGIDMMAGTRNQVGFSYYGIPFVGQGKKQESNYLEIGENYTSVMQLKLVAGRTFTTPGQADYGKSILINEKLAFRFGWSPAEAIGKQVRKNDSAAYTVTGVLKDFTQHTLFSPIESVAMTLVAPEHFTQIIIRAKPGALNAVHEQAKAAWSKLYPMKPFVSYYQDEVAAESSKVNESIAKIFSWFAVISMLMAATGMFALVSLTVLKKTKEIAIRKVVGAEDSHIYKLILSGYSWIFIIAAITGCYAGYSLSVLLMNMIFRINSGVSMTSITVSFLCVCLISAITIFSRVWFVLRTKSTDVLKAN